MIMRSSRDEYGRTLSQHSPIRTPRPSSARPQQSVDRFFRGGGIPFQANGYENYGANQMDHAAWWRLHQMKTNAKQAKEKVPIASLRLSAQYDNGRQDRPFVQPSLPSPRRRPMSAAALPATYMQAARNYPNFKKPIANLVQQNVKWWEADEFKDSQAEVVEEVKKEVIQTKRGWGVLPPGVTGDDVRRAAGAIKEKLIDKFGTLTKAFRAIDEDASGTITREELDRYMVVLNLNTVARPDVITALFELIDADESNNFDYKEFSRVMSAGDVMQMSAVKEKFDGYQAKIDEEKARERAAKEHEARLVGMTVEEYEDYWGATKAIFKQETSADMAVVLRDKWGKRIKGPLQSQNA